MLLRPSHRVFERSPRFYGVRALKGVCKVVLVADCESFPFRKWGSHEVSGTEDFVAVSALGGDTWPTARQIRSNFTRQMEVNIIRPWAALSTWAEDWESASAHAVAGLLLPQVQDPRSC